jgi:hypothetical protein
LLKEFNLTVAINSVSILKQLNNTPIIGANHPSAIFYDMPVAPDWSSLMFKGLYVMQQDLISACW